MSPGGKKPTAWPCGVCGTEFVTRKLRPVLVRVKGDVNRTPDQSFNMKACSSCRNDIWSALESIIEKARGI